MAPRVGLEPTTLRLRVPRPFGRARTISSPRRVLGASPFQLQLERLRPSGLVSARSPRHTMRGFAQDYLVSLRGLGFPEFTQFFNRGFPRKLHLAWISRWRWRKHPFSRQPRGTPSTAACSTIELPGSGPVATEDYSRGDSRSKRYRDRNGPPYGRLAAKAASAAAIVGPAVSPASRAAP